MGSGTKAENMRIEENTANQANVRFDQIMSSDAASSPKIQSILRIPVNVQVIVGSTTLAIENLVKLGPGAVVPLDRRIGEPVDIVVNGRAIARGEVVVLEDDNTRFGVSLTEILDPRWGSFDDAI
jgi:flagellar motor switch protein FliN/FliY